MKFHDFILLTIVGALLLPGVSAGSEGCTRAVLQEVLGLNHERLVSDHFEIRRGFRQYRNVFDRPVPGKTENALTDALMALEPGDAIVDFGAGSGKALIDYLSLAGWKHVPSVAVGYRRPAATAELIKSSLTESRSKLFTYLEGRYLEDIPDIEIPVFGVAFDLYGVLSYTIDVTQVLNKYLRRMRANHSRVFITLTEATRVNLAAGGSVTLAEWLGRQEGIRLTHLGHEAYMIEKTLAEVVVPELFLSRLDSMAPPYRDFSEVPMRLAPISETLPSLRRAFEMDPTRHAQEYLSELRRVVSLDARYRAELENALRALDGRSRNGLR